jgi:hypothetical protein
MEMSSITIFEGDFYNLYFSERNNMHNDISNSTHSIRKNDARTYQTHGKAWILVTEKCNRTVILPFFRYSQKARKQEKKEFAGDGLKSWMR